MTKKTGDRICFRSAGRREISGLEVERKSPEGACFVELHSDYLEDTSDLSASGFAKIVPVSSDAFSLIGSSTLREFELKLSEECARLIRPCVDIIES